MDKLLIEEKNKKTIHQKLVRDLRAAILTGIYKPGDTLPTEATLVNKYCVSRHQVRNALQELAIENLITRRQGSGSIVNKNVTHASKKSIGILMQDPREWLGSSIIATVEKTLSASNYRLELITAGDTQEKFDKSMESLIHSHLDGAIIMPLPWLTNHEWAYKLKTAGTKFVCVDIFPPFVNVNKVIMDNFKGGYMAASHLINQGYRRFCYLQPIGSANTSANRLNGFMAALEDAGKQAESCHFLRYQVTQHKDNRHWIDAEKRWAKFLDNEFDYKFPLGVCATSDYEAYGICHTSIEKGLSVPEQIGIVGFDDRDLSILSRPQLSTIKQFPDKIGIEAAKIIISQFDNPNQEFSEVVIEPELVIRQSSLRISETDCGPEQIS